MVKGLGKGLSALFQDETVHSESEVRQILIRKIVPNPFQPRKIFKQEALEELSKSIEEHGVLQPIIVRKNGTKFELVAGERRYRASKLAGLKEIPAIVKTFTEQEMMELAILENLQREDLTPIEEAEAYASLIEHLNFTQEDLAKRLGKSRPHITNHLRLLQLPEEVRTDINEGAITMGHGRALLGLKNKRMMVELSKRIAKESLNVRQVERLVQAYNDDVSRGTNTMKKRDIFVQATESRLRDHFGTQVQIKKSQNKGKIEIEFYSEDDLQRILDLLRVEVE